MGPDNLRPALTTSLLSDKTLADTTSLDNPARVEIRKSSWNRFTHYFEKRSLDKMIECEVKGLFCKHYGFHDREVFARIWSKIGANDIWNSDSELTMGKLRAIDSKFRKELIFHGPGIASPATSNIDKRVAEIVSILLHGGKVKSAFRDKEIAKAIFVTHDPRFMTAFAEAVQNEFDNLAANPPKTDTEAIVWKAFHGNLIALLPFTYPKSGTTIVIPTLNADMTCRKVSYTVEVIDLPLTGHSTPMSALGLTPKEETPGAPNYISFLGTTFPAASGFAATVMADFTPGHAVGEAVYKLNKGKLDDWLEGKENVHALGMSLGGAMSLHLLRDNHSKLAQVDAYVPAGLYGEWGPISETCKVNIYTQPGDIVSMLGTFPTGDNVTLYKTYAHQDNVADNIYSSHVRVFTGCKEVTILREDPAKENNSFGRKFLIKMHQILGPLLVFLPVSITLGFYSLAIKVRNAIAKIFHKE